MPRDDPWTLDAIIDAPSRLRLINARTQQTLELLPDNVREFRSPDFLLLRCQVTTGDDRTSIEPLIGNLDAPAPVTPVPLDDVLAEIARGPLIGQVDRAKSFVGLLVQCEGPLGSLTPLSPDRVRVGIMLPETDVFFEVNRSRYPSLALAKKGATIMARGIYLGSAVGLLLADAEITDIRL